MLHICCTLTLIVFLFLLLLFHCSTCLAFIWNLTQEVNNKRTLLQHSLFHATDGLFFIPENVFGIVFSILVVCSFLGNYSCYCVFFLKFYLVCYFYAQCLLLFVRDLSSLPQDNQEVIITSYFLGYYIFFFCPTIEATLTDNN